ncbi:MAG: signal peptide peptidase SppA [Porphyromonadaceae bacterium]|nr:signal peptide peptidase SppA [Porphyromonadaceae bacterium]MBF1372748.1 signal peptide peptidase SppA [Porphyromonadaceae bacterium]
MEEPLQPKKPLGFWKTVLASFVGFIAANILCSIFAFFLFIVIVVGALASGSTPTEIQDGSVLKIDLSSISEIVTTDELSSFIPGMGSDEKPISLSQALSSIRKAKADSRIRGIYLNVEGYSGGMASTADLREALKDFRSSGKFIISYADSYDQKAYYLSSVANKVILNPQGMVGLVGLASAPTFYRQALDKLGVKAHIFKVGTYKGAVEPFMLDKLSEPNREQISVYLNGLWDFMLREISASRSVPVDSLRAFADSGRAFGEAETFVRAHLVDTLAYRLDVEDLMAQRLDVASADDIPVVTLSDFLTEPDPLDKDRTDKDNVVKVLFAEGEITESPLSSDGITSDLARDLRALRDDPTAKAVVLRINSPGGSAFLSEQIWHEVRELSQSRTVVVSMGDVAASGGYYIASAADAIVASPVTLTGSIGIFGILPDASELGRKVGVSIDVVQTSPYADMSMSDPMAMLLRPLTPEKGQLIQMEVERGYKTFLSRVAMGRDMSVEAVDSVGQGRVWLGAKAKELGLVDELGGLETAIRLAARLAGLHEGYSVDYGSTSTSFLEELFASKTADRFTARLRDFFMTDEEKKIREFFREGYRYTGILARLPYEYTSY